MKHKKIKHSGKIGDIVYSLPAVERLMKKDNAKAVFYLTEEWYKPLHRFLKRITYIADVVMVKDYNGIKIDYDMDRFREEGYDIVDVPLIRSYFKPFGLDETNWNDYFLVGRIEPPIMKPSYIEDDVYNLMNLTERTRTGFDWKDYLTNYSGPPIYFIGLPHEYEYVKSIDLLNKVKGHLPTKDISDVFDCMCFCESLIGNQSVPVTLSQGLGTPNYLEIYYWNGCVRNYRDSERFLN